MENPEMIRLKSRRAMAWAEPRRQGVRQAKSIRVSLVCRAAGTALLAALSLTVSPAFAQNGEKIATTGNAAGAPACVTCHGANGQGLPAAGFPRLAGLHPAYFVRQLQSFQDATRANPLMAPIAQQLNDADRQALAAYYGALAVSNHEGEPPAAPASLLAGEALAQHGDWNKGLPACAQCHGLTGLGVGAAFPPIAGQSPAYIAAQLRAWQAGTRKNDPMGLMHGIAVKLSAADVDAIAIYYGSLAAAPGTKQIGKP
jgi:cytochrome c553